MQPPCKYLVRFHRSSFAQPFSRYINRTTFSSSLSDHRYHLQKRLKPFSFGPTRKLSLDTGAFEPVQTQCKLDYSLGKKMVSHILFDFDGTLVDSVDHLVVLVDQLIKEKDPTLAINKEIRDYCPNLTSLDNLCDLINSQLNLSIDRTDFKRFILTKLPRLPELKLMPGVEKLVKHLHKQNIPMAVCSGGLRPYYDRAIQNFGDFFKYFEHSTLAYDDPCLGPNKGKPKPDCYLVSVSRFATPPKDMSNVLIFEDSITGLKGAIASGAKTVLVTKSTSIYTDENADLLKKANLILDSLENFQPEQFGLPPY